MKFVSCAFSVSSHDLFPSRCSSYSFYCNSWCTTGIISWHFGSSTRKSASGGRVVNCMNGHCCISPCRTPHCIAWLASSLHTSHCIAWLASSLRTTHCIAWLASSLRTSHCIAWLASSLRTLHCIACPASSLRHHCVIPASSLLYVTPAPADTCQSGRHLE